MSRRIRRFSANYLTTLAFIGLSYVFITYVSGFHRNFLQGEWQLEGIAPHIVIRVQQVFIALIALYAVVLIPYYAAYPWMRSKSLLFAQGLWLAARRTFGSARNRADTAPPPQLPLRYRLSPLAAQSGRALLLKFFFAPLMINWCLIHLANIFGAILQLKAGIEYEVPARALFDTGMFWSAFQLIMFVDTLLFTLGYIVEVPALGNRIRSVDPTFFGWFVCLMCYPPFNDFTTRFLESRSTDFPFFENDAVHVIINVVVLVALAIFSWASVALGFKASNLTNRGIVSHGPYAVVRHPAYIAKNIAWWLGALPILGMQLAAGTWRELAYSVVSVLGWSAIYVLRALTEERHLLMLNNGYAEYAAKVRWRFIPRVW